MEHPGVADSPHPARSERPLDGPADVARGRVEALGERAARDPETLRRDVSRAIRVPAPDLQAVQPEPLGEVVHLRLDGEGGLEVAVPPHRARVHVVRVDDRRVEPDARAAVEAGERGHHDVRGRRSPGHVGAVVDQDPGVAGEQRPVGPRRGAKREDARFARRARDELLFAVEHDLHRPADVPGQERGDDVDRVEVEPPPEVSAHRRLDDADAVPGDAERLGKVLLVEERDLGHRPHREVPARIPLGGRRHGAEARGGDVVQAVGSLDHDVRLADGAVDVAGRELVGEVDEVARELRVDPGRPGPERRLRVEDRRQLLVLHVDQPAGLLGDLLGLGGHRRHLVPDAADDVGLEGQVVLRVPERTLLDVPARHDAQDARERLRAGRVDPRDAGVGDRRPQDLAPDHARQFEVREVLDRARYLLHGVELGDARADDAERPRRTRHRRGTGSPARPRTTSGPAHAFARAARMRSAATCTARMILT